MSFLSLLGACTTGIKVHLIPFGRMHLLLEQVNIIEGVTMSNDRDTGSDEACITVFGCEYVYSVHDNVNIIKSI